MRDEQKRPGPTHQEFFQPVDRVDIQVIGGFIQQEQVRIPDQAAPQQHPPLQPGGKNIEFRPGIQAQA